MKESFREIKSLFDLMYTVYIESKSHVYSIRDIVPVVRVLNLLSSEPGLYALMIHNSGALDTISGTLGL